MSQKSSTKDLQPIYAQYINSHDQQDEISLIDLWITLLNFKKTYLWSFIFSVMVGISAVTLLSTPRYEMTTVLTIASYNNEPIETPAAVISRFNTLILPLELKFIAEANNGLRFATDFFSPIGTNLIEIKNQVSDSQVDILGEFQSNLSAKVIQAHQDLLFSLDSNLRQSIVLEEALRPETLTKEAYVKKFNPDAWRTIALLEDEIQKRTDNSVTNEQSDNADLESLERTLLISREVNGLIKEKVGLVRDLSVSYDAYVVRVKASERKILELKDNIETELTRVAIQSQLSSEPVSRSKNSLYFMVILLSLFLAFAFTLVVMFRAKVIEQMAEEVKQ
jgi:hypothetical protein